MGGGAAQLDAAARCRGAAAGRSWNQTTLGVTRYIIGHSLKVQADLSYNHRSESLTPNYNRWELRFQVELGL